MGRSVGQKSVRVHADRPVCPTAQLRALQGLYRRTKAHRGEVVLYHAQYFRSGSVGTDIALAFPGNSEFKPKAQ